MPARASAQQQQQAVSPFAAAPAQAAALQASGIRKDRGHVTAWFPRDSLSDARMDAVVTRLDSGVSAVIAIIGAPRSWQHDQDQRVTYFFPPERFISHGGPLGVFISFWRIKSDSAPPVHEAVHILLAPSFLSSWRAAWLSEGIADYIGGLATQRAGLPADFDVFQQGGIAGADAACRERLATPGGQAILPYIGVAEAPPNLLTDRAGVARPFYACAHSFVKYLAMRFGIENVFGMFANPNAAPTAIQGHALTDLRPEWLHTIGAR
jgi:hypothetical protein